MILAGVIAFIFLVFFLFSISTAPWIVVGIFAGMILAYALVIFMWSLFLK